MNMPGFTAEFALQTKRPLSEDWYISRAGREYQTASNMLLEPTVSTATIAMQPALLCLADTLAGGMLA
jgi:hypothetical protein